MKLNQDEKILVCNLLAQYKKPKQIQKILEDEYDLTVKTTTIKNFRDGEKELIDKLRERYLSTVSEVPIAQKRVRLERAENLYEEAEKIKETKEVIDTKLKCLAEARTEVEGKQGTSITFAQYNQYSQMTDDELQDKIKEIELKIAKQNAIEVNQ